VAIASNINSLILLIN